MKTYKEIHTNNLIEMIKEDENGIHEEKITDEEYNKIISYIPYMNHEILRYSYYSKYGYKIIRYIKSISPDGKKYIIYRFKV